MYKSAKRTVDDCVSDDFDSVEDGINLKYFVFNRVDIYYSGNKSIASLVVRSCFAF